MAAEKKADDIEKRLNENLEELQGIEKVKRMYDLNMFFFLIQLIRSRTVERYQNIYANLSLIKRAQYKLLCINF